MGNYFPGIPDLRPRRLRLRLFEKAWFKLFDVELKEDYEIDVDARMNEIPYYLALIREEFSAEYTSSMEREFLEEFGKLVEGGMTLCLGCGDGRELRLLQRKGLGVDIFPSNIILSNSLGIKTILADMLSLPFKNEVFNGILALQSLEYIPVRLTRGMLTEIYRVLRPYGIALFSLEKTPGSEVDMDFNYIYEDEYVRVKKHFHRGWGREGLRIINELFKVLKLSEDEGYYYVIALKRLAPYC
ncbi:MAG: class I SAM-dependent methyltransferase [Desulfurococcales archaeon]|nr:class I SAM-dependent methyltransferase [Desulfurococcales archaeon]